MADLHSLFQGFNNEISISTSKKDKMKRSRDSLREKIRRWFKDYKPDYIPKFYIQGSFKMNSAIRTKDDICDLDDGIYFFRTPDVEATTLQKWVKEAVEGHTGYSTEHRKKCIRTTFAGDYEIDHPVYVSYNNNQYQLAVKNNGWEFSDAKGMVDWFNSKKDGSGRLLRIVKYLKAWGDYKRNKMPSGLVMTILASNAMDKIVSNSRDDITIRDILKEIKKALTYYGFQCQVPAAPHDNLFAEYDDVRRDNFLKALDDFIADADAALKEDNFLKSSRLWRKHLGDRFPHGEDEKDSSMTNAFTKTIITGAARSTPWSHE